MNSKQKHSVGTQWIMPFAFLILIMMALLINFSITGHKTSREKVETTIENQAEAYSSQLYSELDTMTKAGIPMCSLVGKYSKNDDFLTISLAKALHEDTIAYNVVFANMQGEGITQNGKVVDLRKEEYFDPQISAQKYSYAEEECIDGKSAIVSAIPIFNQDIAAGVLYMYYPADRFEKLFTGTVYVEDTCYFLTLDEGKIARKTGYHTDFVKEENLFHMLWGDDPQQSELKGARNKVMAGKAGTLVVERQDVKKCFVYAPLKINDWYLFTAIDEKSITRLTQKDWRSMGQIVKQLMFTILAFFSYLVIALMVNRLKFAQKSKNLEERADKDLLMELYNKIATEREIRRYIEENPDKQALFFLIDIDNFKKINDTMGHAFGDEVLRAIGNRLRMEFRKTDICGRIGGDEVLIFLKDIPCDAAVEVEKERVSSIFRNFKVGEYVKYTVTASIGGAVYMKDGKSFEALYKSADKALYISKRNGKNQLTFYGEEKKAIEE